MKVLYLFLFIYLTIITTLKWLISYRDFEEFIPFGNLQGNTYKANQHSGHSTVIITYSREDLVQIGNIVRHDRSLNRLQSNTCYKIRILRLNNIPTKRKQRSKRAGRYKNLAYLGPNLSNLINIRCIPNVMNMVKIGCFTVIVRSLYNKEINVHEYIWNKEMDFGVITETWYKDNWLLSDLNTLGLKQDAINHNDGRTGGGLSLVFRSQYPCEWLKISKHQSLELGLWKLNIKGIHMVVLSIYRPPYSKHNKISDNEAVDDLLDCLTNVLPNYSNIIIMGDLNFHWNDFTNPLIHILDDSIQALGLDQVVDQPTHKNGNNLDLIMIEDWHNDREYKVQVGDFLSDHKFVSLQLNLLKESVSYKHVMTRNLKELNKVSFKEKLATINLCTKDASATQFTATYDNKILEILNDLAPIKKRLIKERVPKPWFSDEIDWIRKAYRKCHTNWTKTHCETDW